MKDFISISFDFIDKYVRFTRPEYIQVYLYAKYISERDGSIPSSAELAAALDIPEARIEFIFEYWASRDELSGSKGSYFIPKESPASSQPEKPHKPKRIASGKPSYSQAEINAAAIDNKQISALFYQAESVLGKVLTASDMELLFSFNDWLGLPVEVITMLLSYASKRGKTTKRYLEAVAIDWADKGIDTYEAAEEYVSCLEAADSAEAEVRSILGIYNRGLSTTERKYIKLWVTELQIPAKLISLAYDRTVERTGKLSWSYMDKMLRAWIEKDCKNADDVKALDDEFYKNGGAAKPLAAPKKSKFNNYEDDNKTDYAKLEEQILDMMLDE